MESITQSYNMYDSATFKLVKNVRAILEKKPDHKLGESEEFIHEVTAKKNGGNDELD